MHQAAPAHRNAGIVASGPPLVAFAFLTGNPCLNIGVTWWKVTNKTWKGRMTMISMLIKKMNNYCHMSTNKWEGLLPRKSHGRWMEFVLGLQKILSDIVGRQRVIPWGQWMDSKMLKNACHFLLSRLDKAACRLDHRYLCSNPWHCIGHIQQCTE